MYEYWFIIIHPSVDSSQLIPDGEVSAGLCDYRRMSLTYGDRDKSEYVSSKYPSDILQTQPMGPLLSCRNRQH